MTYRTPPKPEYFDSAPKGTCRWCNQLTGLTPKGKVKTSRWHNECLKEYQKLFWPSTTRKEVWKRDAGICNSCQAQCDKHNNGWHMDHINPLIEAKGDLTFWQMENLQTLCKTCHINKTSKEATTRASERKIRKQKANI